MDARVPLYKKLEDLKSEQVYPFHMPGHKRCGIEEYLCSVRSADADRFKSDFDRILQMDITEVEPFDDLNHPTGELKDAMERCARFYGVRETFFLVNGSTGGICAAIDSVCRPGDEILMARNSHISVYRQVMHAQLTPAYLYPQEITVGDVRFYGAITKEELERGLKQHPNAKAILVVSPTYDGIISDIPALAEVAHKHEKILIVDEAHGAHLPFIRPEYSAICGGADLVIQSAHKTLPAMTQTALLHRCSKRVDEQKLRDSVAYFSSTSPSYVLVAALLRCMDFMEKHGKTAMEAFYARLEAFYKRCEDLSAVELFGPFWGNDAPTGTKIATWKRDPSKIVILCPHRGMQVARMLRDAKIETECCSSDWVLALASLFDGEEAFDRLYRALTEIPAMPGREGEPLGNGSEMADAKNADVKSPETKIRVTDVSEAARVAQFMKPWEVYYQKASDGEYRMAHRECELAEAVGRVSVDTVYVYPPGIPQIVCGEFITREAIDRLEELEKAGFTLRGLTGKDQITVLKK